MEKSKKMRYKKIMQTTQDLQRLTKQASIASLATAFSLIVIKGLTFFMTGSVAILSGLFDSVQDLMTSGVNYYAVKQSNEPADSHHRFGHGKAQALGGIIQGGIIVLASLFLLRESFQRLLSPQPIAHAGAAIFITLIAIVITVVLVRFQTFVIKKTNCLSIKADRAHYTGDVWMNVGVICSVIFSHFFGLLFLDALFGIGVSFYLLFVVYQILKESIAMLMDAEMPGAFRQNIKKIVLACPDVQYMADLKTRLSGDQIFIQFCIRLDENLTLRQAHVITDEIEAAILRKYPQAHIIIHPEPFCPHKEKKS